VIAQPPAPEPDGHLSILARHLDDVLGDLILR
jgi:hypothetical protein